MFLSAKAFFNNHTEANQRLLIRASTELPAEWLRLYKKNVVNITPKRTGALRRSIITQQIGTGAEVSWRAPYAAAQNQGGHYVPQNVRGINPATGRGSTIKAGYYSYRKYTTAGTGPRFANIAFQKTNSEMPAVARALGLTK